MLQQVNILNRYRNTNLLPTTIPELRQYIERVGVAKLEDMYDDTYDDGYGGFHLRILLENLTLIKDKEP